MPQTPYEADYSGNSANNRVRESPGRLVLPEFESLPATAGLNNTEAFQLSIRHALTLLPALFAKGLDDRTDGDNPERFSLARKNPKLYPREIKIWLATCASRFSTNRSSNRGRSECHGKKPSAALPLRASTTCGISILPRNGSATKIPSAFACPKQSRTMVFSKGSNHSCSIKSTADCLRRSDSAVTKRCLRWIAKFRS